LTTFSTLFGLYFWIPSNWKLPPFEFFNKFFVFGIKKIRGNLSHLCDEFMLFGTSRSRETACDNSEEISILLKDYFIAIDGN
jgi:hypothetical protein